VFGLEKIMGQKDTPVRKVLNYAWDKFADRFPMVLHILTVIGRKTDGRLAVRGLYIGDDLECFNRASELSQQVNIEMLDTPLKKCVVYLDPSEYKSTWLGNKAIYRTRMAMADGGELIILAPGLQQFGEDPEIDTLIRKYGYKGTSATLEAVKKQKELQHNLSAAAHLIHGSSEERFQITYCPGILSEEEVRAVNFNYANINEMMKIYNPETRKDGYNQMPYDEEIFYISNPGLGLWSTKHNF
jgi:nickel-dependent lactate racemase